MEVRRRSIRLASRALPVSAQTLGTAGDDGHASFVNEVIT